MSFIEVNHLTFGYGKEALLKDVSFKVEKGTFVTIAGPNGAGKSTLLNLITARLRPAKGNIILDSKPLKKYSTKELAKKIAVVRQEFVPAFGFNAMETVLMARTPYFDQLGFERQSDMDIVEKVMIQTDTIRFAGRALGQLSAGERQRVFIARALAQDTDVIVLDEPTNFLDLKHQVETYDIIKKMQLQDQKTIIAVTHDINLANQYTDLGVLLCSDGSYHFGEDIFTQETIQKAFDVMTCAANIGNGKFFLPLGKFAKDYPSGTSG